MQNYYLDKGGLYIFEIEGMYIPFVNFPEGKVTLENEKKNT